MRLASRNAKGCGAWLVVAMVGACPGGSALAQSATDRSVAAVEQLKDEGERVYRSKCARCHGENGNGRQHSHDSAPRLFGSFVKLGVDEITVRILRGGAYMPPFTDLTDREIAAVATFVRNSFGNDLGPVTVADVAGKR